MNKENMKKDKWEKEYNELLHSSSTYYHQDFKKLNSFRDYYFAACKKRTEETRLKNERALVSIYRLTEIVSNAIDIFRVEEDIETIKAALES